MNIRIFFLLCFLSSACLFGQTTKSITLLDAETNEPIMAANVFNKSLSVGSISDASGKLEIFGSPSDSIIITHIGCNKKAFVFKDMPAKVVLQSGSTALKEVKTLVSAIIYW